VAGFIHCHDYAYFQVHTLPRNVHVACRYTHPGRVGRDIRPLCFHVLIGKCRYKRRLPKNCAWLEAGSLKSNLAMVALFVPDANYTVRSPPMVAASQPQPPFGQTSDSGGNDHHHGKILQAAQPCQRPLFCINRRWRLSQLGTAIFIFGTWP